MSYHFQRKRREPALGNLEAREALKEESCALAHSAPESACLFCTHNQSFANAPRHTVLDFSLLMCQFFPSTMCLQDDKEADGPALQMNLLQALLCAGMHSRAAYGYAMAAGHLSSLLNFALLQTVSHALFGMICISQCSGLSCSCMCKPFSMPRTACTAVLQCRAACHTTPDACTATAL